MIGSELRAYRRSWYQFSFTLPLIRIKRFLHDEMPREYLPFCTSRRVKQNPLTCFAPAPLPVESDAESTGGEVPISKPKAEPEDGSMKEANEEEDDEAEDEDEETYAWRPPPAVSIL